MKKLFACFLSAALCIVFISGCSEAQASSAATQAASETTSAAADVTVSESLLENVKLTLPETISREDVSDTRAYFYQDGEIVGGIALLDIAGEMDTMDLQDYIDQALAVTQEVYDSEYDYIAEDDPDYCALVSVSCHAYAKEFYHYFFSGTQMGYDIWMDYSVLSTSQMRTCLETLQSEDLYNPLNR